MLLTLVLKKIVWAEIARSVPEIVILLNSGIANWNLTSRVSLNSSEEEAEELKQERVTVQVDKICISFSTASIFDEQCKVA